MKDANTHLSLTRIGLRSFKNVNISWQLFQALVLKFIINKIRLIWELAFLTLVQVTMKLCSSKIISNTSKTDTWGICERGVVKWFEFLEIRYYCKCSFLPFSLAFQSCDNRMKQNFMTKITKPNSATTLSLVPTMV